ncbi:MAG: T9SS type A sorting domain-containing protein [Bacteroidota bacterium]
MYQKKPQSFFSFLALIGLLFMSLAAVPAYALGDDEGDDDELNCSTTDPLPGRIIITPPLQPGDIIPIEETAEYCCPEISAFIPDNQVNAYEFVVEAFIEDPSNPGVALPLNSLPYRVESNTIKASVVATSEDPAAFTMNFDLKYASTTPRTVHIVQTLYARLIANPTGPAITIGTRYRPVTFQSNSGERQGFPSMQDLNVSLRPNPTSGAVLVQLNEGQNQPALVRLLNLQGQTLKAATIPGGQTTLKWDVSHLPRGIYLIEVRAGKARTHQKLVLRNQ